MATEDDTDSEFDKILTEEEKVGLKRRLEDAPPIGMGAGGTLNTVEPGAPPFEPEVVPGAEDDDEEDDDLADLEDIDRSVTGA